LLILTDLSREETVKRFLNLIRRRLRIMKLTPNWILPGCLVGGLLFAQSLHAGLTFTIENPGVQATTVPGAITETFNELPLGLLPGAGDTYASPGIGLFTGGVIHAPNAYGGSFASDYYAVGAESGTTLGTLTLNTPQDYFGMYWPAGDDENVLEFFDGAAMIASYNVGSIIPHLSPAYFGNPNNGEDPTEPFVYLDFTTTGSTQITSVDFMNGLGTGFEIDNISVLGTPITPPGHAIPDATNAALLLLITVGTLFGYRRFRLCQ
jgi:hypothetical protein